MKISNNLKVYCKSMGKIYRITHIAKTDEEANDFCRKNNDSAVIAEDTALSLIFIAEKYQIAVPSNILPD